MAEEDTGGKDMREGVEEEHTEDENMGKANVEEE